MTFGRRQQPPTGTQPPRPQPDGARTVPAPPLQPPDPEPFNPNIIAASQDFLPFLLAEYADDNGMVHAPTAIGAAAALTGEFAQRAGDVPFGEGRPGYVFGDQINDILIEGMEKGRVTVWDCLRRAARDCGVPETDIPDPIGIIKNVADAVGGPSFPPLTVPRQHYPREYSPNACVRLRPKVIAIADRFDLSRRDLAIALAMTAYGLILFAKDTVPPAVAVRLAAEIAFGVAKMAPLTAPIG